MLHFNFKTAKIKLNNKIYNHKMAKNKSKIIGRTFQDPFMFVMTRKLLTLKQHIAAHVFFYFSIWAVTQHLWKFRTIKRISSKQNWSYNFRRLHQTDNLHKPNDHRVHRTSNLHNLKNNNKEMNNYGQTKEYVHAIPASFVIGPNGVSSILLSILTRILRNKAQSL